MEKWEMGKTSKKREEGEIKIYLDKDNKMGDIEAGTGNSP